jgi:hypothetical protein
MRIQRAANESEAVMKIRFLEDVGCTLVDSEGNEMDETFESGSEHEGDLLFDSEADNELMDLNGDKFYSYISFGFQNGWQMHGLKKSQFEVVP